MGHGQQMAIFLLLLHLQPSNSSRGFVDKTEARLAPGCVQLHSEALNGTDVLLGVGKGHGRIGEQGQTRCWQHLSMNWYEAQTIGWQLTAKIPLPNTYGQIDVLLRTIKKSKRGRPTPSLPTFWLLLLKLFWGLYNVYCCCWNGFRKFHLLCDTFWSAQPPICLGQPTSIDGNNSIFDKLKVKSE